MITVQQLADACNLSHEQASEWHQPLVAAMTFGKCVTPNQQAMFLATCGHESAGFTDLEEGFNYSPRGLVATWSSRYPPEEDGSISRLAVELGRGPSGKRANQRAIADHAYGDRGGNNGDGYTHRGRGAIQLTHYDNYKACGDAIGIDLIADPDIVATPRVGALAAGWFWLVNKLYMRTDFLGINRVVNLGRSNTKRMPHGWDDRRERYHRAKAVLSKPMTAHERAQQLLGR